MQPWTIGAAGLVGAVSGIGAILATTVVYKWEDFFARLPIHWMWWPALGALLVGAVGYFDPRAFGVGYESIHEILQGKLLPMALATLIVSKGLAWSVALGSGTSGGVLAPLLMIGGSIGALTGNYLFGGESTLWAMVGMTAMMTGAMRAPLASALFLAELTGAYHALPALLAGSMAAMVVTAFALKRSILTEKLARRGQHITQEYQVDPLALVRVKAVMSSEYSKVSAETTIVEIMSRITAGDPELIKRQAILVFAKDGSLEGLLTRGDLLRALEEDASGLTPAVELVSKPPIVAYPEETVNQAMSRMLENDVGRLPVVSPENPRKVVGYLGRADMLNARKQMLFEESRRERPLLNKVRKRTRAATA
jgi:CBS domain-containing protein